jgi:membrane associated rhomboid family serine protease
MGPDRFLDTVATLLEEPLDGELLGLAPTIGIAALRDGTFAMVVSARVGGADEVEAIARDFVRSNSAQNLKIVCVGGGAEHRAALERVQPAVMLGRVVQVFAIDRSGEVWAGARSRLDSPMGTMLRTVAGRAEPRAIDPHELRAKIVTPTEQDRAHAEEAHSFVETTKRGVPNATLGALAIIVTMFGLEWMWGGTELVPTLVRMGANGKWALEGEPWRLLSSAWLHAGVLHVLVNSYVLYSLGGFLERMFGMSRFIVLYVMAALGGGIASAMLSDAALSVGASGAIWGVLGASVALAWRPADLVPAAVLPQFRRNAVVNVLINLAISFAPNIDMMAHFGGGLVGAALVLTGVITRGVTRDAATSTKPWTFAAVVTGAVMVAAPIIALVVGRPWLLFAPGNTTHELADVATVRLPTQIGAPTVNRDVDYVEIEAGDILRDRAAVSIVVKPLPVPLAPEDMEAAFEEFKGLPTESPEGAEQVGGREVDVGKGDGPRTFVERYDIPNGLTLLTIFQLHPTATARIDAIYWSEHEGTGQELRAAARTLTIP